MGIQATYWRQNCQIPVGDARLARAPGLLGRPAPESGETSGLDCIAHRSSTDLTLARHSP
jgi:hypothetical protein